MRTLMMTASLFVATLSAADFSGTWLGEIPIQSKTQRLHLAQEVAFQLIQTGATLTGKLYGDYLNSPIIEGKVSGDTIDFVVIAQEQQGNQINQSRLHFTGALQPDGNIELTRVRENSTNAGNGGAYKGKTTNQTFVIRRLPAEKR